jgi:hypothetical protein
MMQGLATVPDSRSIDTETSLAATNSAAVRAFPDANFESFEFEMDLARQGFRVVRRRTMKSTFS